MSIFKWMMTACMLMGLSFVTMGCEGDTAAPPAQDTDTPQIEMPADDTSETPATDPAETPAEDPETEAPTE